MRLGYPLGRMTAVSYTHLDVYKRQELASSAARRRLVGHVDLGRVPAASDERDPGPRRR